MSNVEFSGVAQDFFSEELIAAFDSDVVKDNKMPVPAGLYEIEFTGVAPYSRESQKTGNTNVGIELSFKITGGDDDFLDVQLTDSLLLSHPNARPISKKTMARLGADPETSLPEQTNQLAEELVGQTWSVEIKQSSSGWPNYYYKGQQ